MRLRPEDRKEMAELTNQLKAVEAELRQARKDRDKFRDQLALEQEIESLKRELVDLEIEQAKVNEDNDREKREIEHKVGLERKRQEMELELTTRESKVTVREENLNADRARFEEQMAFTTKRFEQESENINALMQQILKRLPSVTEHIEFSAGNGKKEERV